MSLYSGENPPGEFREIGIGREEFSLSEQIEEVHIFSMCTD